VALDLTFHQKRADRRQPSEPTQSFKRAAPIGRLVPAGGAVPPSRRRRSVTGADRLIVWIEGRLWALQANPAIERPFTKT
jgi:hypothetical protein